MSYLVRQMTWQAACELAESTGSLVFYRDPDPHDPELPWFLIDGAGIGLAYRSKAEMLQSVRTNFPGHRTVTVVEEVVVFE